MKKILFIFALLYIIPSCTNKRSYNEVMINGFDNNYSDENTPLSAFIDTIEVIPLASDNNGVVLTNPQKLLLYENNYYILDNNRLLCFGASGKFIRFIGERGHGHGEYINIATFVVFNDTIKLLDSFKNTLITYTLNGEFVSEKEAAEGAFSNVKDAVFEKDNVLFMANYIYNEKNDIYTRWNTLTGKVSVVDNSPVKTDGTKEYVGSHSFCHYNGNIRYILPFSDVIKSTNDNTARFRTAKRILTDSELRDMTDYGIMAYSTRLDDFVGFSNIFETENYLFLTFSNLEYTVVDKRSNECFRRSYQYDEDAEAFPLLNILSSTEDALIGIIDVEHYSHLKEKNQCRAHATCGKDYGYVVVVYHVK